MAAVLRAPSLASLRYLEAATPRYRAATQAAAAAVAAMARQWPPPYPWRMAASQTYREPWRRHRSLQKTSLPQPAHRAVAEVAAAEGAATQLLSSHARKTIGGRPRDAGAADLMATAGNAPSRGPHWVSRVALV